MRDAVVERAETGEHITRKRLRRWYAKAEQDEQKNQGIRIKAVEELVRTPSWLVGSELVAMAEAAEIARGQRHMG
jgi:hypothetical protein